MFVLHRCDYRHCVNPNHLRVGTHTENMTDMRVKGRANRPTGSRNGRAKLKEFQVIEMRLAAATGRPVKQVAEEYGPVFGITVATATDAILGRTWKSVKVPPVRPGLRRGEASHFARLSEADVRAIRRNYAAGVSAKLLGERYGVKRDHIYRIANQQAWAHVRGDA
jgi:hypothetical protein